MRTRAATTLLLSAALGSASCIIYTGEPVDPREGSRGREVGNSGRAEPPASAPRIGEPLRARAEQLDGRLRGRGFEPLGRPSSGVLAEAAHARYQVDLLSGICYVAFALGGDGARDLGLTLSSRDGTERARDGRGDSRAALRYCALESGRYEVDVHMVDGDGTFVSAIYGAPPGETSSLAELLEGEGRPAGPSEGPPPAGVEAAVWQRLGPATADLESRGFQPLGSPASVSITQGSRVRRRVPLAQGSCYALLAVAGSGIQDADAFVFDASGVRVAFDAGGDRDARLTVCPERSGPHVLELRAVRGGGVVTAALFQATGDQVRRDRSAPAIGPIYAAMDRELESRGYEGLGRAELAQLAQGSRRTVEISLEGGRCYAAAAVGAAGIEDLDLRLLDADGVEVDRDDGEGRTALVRACPAEGGSFGLELTAARGAGRTMHRLYRFLRGTRGAFGLEGLLYLRAMEMVAILASEGYEPAAAPEQSAPAGLAEGAREERTVRLERGTCYAVSAVGGEGLHDVDLELLSPRGESVDAELGRNPLPTVRHCAERTGPHRVRVTAARGSGRYVYQLFERASPED